MSSLLVIYSICLVIIMMIYLSIINRILTRVYIDVYYEEVGMVVFIEYLINWFILVLSKFFNKPP